MIQFRDYQLEAIDSVYSYFARHTGNPVVVMPTGTGKSLVIGGFTTRAMYEFPRTRVMVLTHVKELIKQNAAKLKEVWPDAPVGVYSAGLQSKEIAAPIIFGGVKSVANNVQAFGHRDLLLIDECHLVSPNQQTTYRGVIEELAKINPYLKVIGFTATDFRLGLGRITDGGIFTDVAINQGSVEWWNRFIAHGYLVPPIPRRTQTALDVSNVGINNGEFAQGAMQAAVDTSEINFKIAQEICHEARDRRSWLIFCSGVEHSEHMAEVLRHFGISAVSVHSKMKPNERDARIAAYQAGQVRCIVNANMLTTGFDDPKTDYIGMVRPTMSPGLWVQMLGRGTRPFPGKENCLVSDFARNAERLGPINDPAIPKRPGEKLTSDAPVRLCASCGTYNHASARQCAFCGEAFTFKNKLVETAGDAELLRSTAPLLEWFDVMRVTYRHYEAKKSGNASIRVDYLTSAFKVFSDFHSFEGASFRVHKAHNFWKRILEGEPPPNNETALFYLHTMQARIPRRIQVWTNRQYPEIMQYEF